MLKKTHRTLIILLTLVVSIATAKEETSKTLPAVLIIGDDVYQQVAKALMSDLKDQARVVVAKWPANVLANSAQAIEHIDLLLGFKDAAGKDVPEAKRPIWKMVYLNVGLGDLIYRVPGLKSHRSLPHDLGGEITTRPEQYEKNLDTLIQLIQRKAPSAKILWANTTPIRSTSNNYFRAGSEVEYNQIAERVMKNFGVPINDMYTYVESVLKESKTAIADPFNFGKISLLPPIKNSVLRTLSNQ